MVSDFGSILHIYHSILHESLFSQHIQAFTAINIIRLYIKLITICIFLLSFMAYICHTINRIS